MSECTSTPVPFAYDYMMRTGRVNDERLRRMDPEFAELMDQHNLALSNELR
jgi:hypothetical protein